MHERVIDEASALSDSELLSRIDALAADERRASVELVAHLAVLDTRAVLYAAGGHGSLFGYCTQALRLSEDAACNRIAAARACRRFPRILDMLASGKLSLTAIRLIGKHLTADNHAAVLARAEGRTCAEIEALVAELAPQPDVASTIRRLPARQADAAVSAVQFVAAVPLIAPPPGNPPVNAPPPAPRPVVAPLAPERYRVQFTIGRATEEKLRRLQALLRREIPDGDPAVIFDRAVSLLLEHVEKKKLGKTARPQAAIRRKTDKDEADPDAADGLLPTRHPRNAVKRTVWERDGGRCAYVSPQGRRCDERAFLEFHHDQPYALRGEATVDNIALRCRRHNEYEATLVFR